MAAIFFFVFREAAPVLFREEFSLGQFLFSTEWYPTSANNVRYGTLALIVGTLQRHRARHGSSPCPSASAPRSTSPSSARPACSETLKIVIELLAAIPSVVWGFIGLTVMSKLIVQLHRRAGGREHPERRDHPRADERADHRLDRRGRAQGRARLLPRGRRWPSAPRAGSSSTGCSLPAAQNGLLAAVLLGVGRAVGETMAVLMATGHAVHIPHSILDSVRTLTANIAAELGEAPAGSDHYRVLFLTGMLLFLITFVVNLTADFVVRGIRRK